MSTIVDLNGIPYAIPDTGDTGWGTDVHNYLVALGSGGVLQLAGGDFPLLSEVNFGPNFGIASPYFRSGQDPAATDGVLRLTNTESIMWRNAADTGNLALSVVGGALYFAGNPIGGTPLTTKGDLITFSTSAVRLPVGANGEALIADSSTATGLKWANVGGTGGSVIGFNFTNANGISGTVTDATTSPNLTLSLGAITPTSVAASGTVTGSNLSGTNTGDQTITLTGDITGSGTGSFATTYAGTVPVAKGGTGATTANAALNNLLPSQSGQTGKLLYTDGTNTSWQSFTGAGTVSSVSTVANNGVTASVANPTTTPQITIGLGNITPTSVVASGTVTASNISGSTSGTNTGDQTISLTGDVTGSGTGTFATTLSNTGVVAGSYTRANITVDSKGRISAASNGALQTITLTGDVTGSGTGTFATTLSNTGVAAGAYNSFVCDTKGRITAANLIGYLTANQTITITGDATGSGTTGIALTLANTSVAAGSYTNATITVDSKGRITAASSGAATVKLNNIIAADGNSEIDSGNRKILWKWSGLTGDFGSDPSLHRGFVIDTGNAGAGATNPILMRIGTSTAGSTVMPLEVYARNNSALLVDSDGTVIFGDFGTGFEFNSATGGSAGNLTLTLNGNAGTAGQVLMSGGAGGSVSWANGVVTSVAMSSTDLTISGSPITSSGTITANLSTTGVSAGTYNSVTVDTKGRVTSAANKIFSGKATLSGGIVTVSNSNVTSASVIQLTHQTISGTTGALYVGTIVDNTSFQIRSTSGSDAGTVGWTIFN